MGRVRAGVLGGTFDPPHIAHLAVGAAARHELALDRVLFVPAGDPWRKADRDVTPAAVRLRMLRAALDPLLWAEVCTVEVERGGPSYSADTMEQLLREAGDDVDWWFIAGDDALADMPNWHEPDRLLAAARLALVWRLPGVPVIPSRVRARFPDIVDRVNIVPMPPLEVSSTDLRERVATGRSTAVLLPEGVRAVIDELGLYR
ncbi:MAG: nicotinate-nucleotide adenylyltransferase [Dehalococcoidia bacterium]